VSSQGGRESARRAKILTRRAVPSHREMLGSLPTACGGLFRTLTACPDAATSRETASCQTRESLQTRAKNRTGEASRRCRNLSSRRLRGLSHRDDT
jgi:hypothetical protein